MYMGGLQYNGGEWRGGWGDGQLDSMISGNTAILLQYFIVITTQSRCKIPGHYSAQGLTILSTRLKGGCFGGI